MISRRHFLQSSLAVALVPMMPRVALSTGLRVWQSWEVFCTGPTFASFCDGIQKMRGNKNADDPASWVYWVNVHKNFCPHGRPYFLAWHRGLLYRFEGWLRKVSGDPNLILPYWNYYDSPQMPSQFLDDSLPLYRRGRTGNDVTGALSLDPFADSIIHFQRGKSDAFEPLLEARPHNPVHNLIGGAMAAVSVSPWDPIFWVHHANIDRLWDAWSKGGGGRRQPAAINTYWDGSFNYGAAIKPVPRRWTTTTAQYLGYEYADTSMPTSLPGSPEPPPTSSTAMASTFSLAGVLPSKPASIAGAPLGSSRPLTLSEQSLSVEVPLTAQDANRVRSAMLKPAVQTAAATEEDSPVRVVLDGVRLTGLGAKGGYFYKVYINLPEQAGITGTERSYLLGMVGPFEIGVAQMKASMKGKGMQGMHDMQASATDQDARLVFPATEALRRTWPSKLDKISISFVRVDGSKHPTKGDTVKVKAFSLEADPAM